MLQWLRKLVSGATNPASPARGSLRVPLRGRYDAASVSDAARRDWANVDALAAEAAAAPDVRALLRTRGRHELLNNPYMDGMLQTHASDIIGRGPRLRMRTRVRAINSLIEREFADWMKRTRIAAKLRLMVETTTSQGEIFAKMFRNPGLSTQVKLDLMLYEGDQVATPNILAIAADRDTDGIAFDRWGNPKTYHVLKEHPGDNRWGVFRGGDYDEVPAEDMIHLFRARRPGQRRGIPRITSSLNLFPQRRSFRQSVLEAARIVAQLGAVTLETDATPPGSADEVDVTPGTSVEIDMGTMTVLPNGYKAKQMEPTQPATTFEAFDNKSIAESGRPLNMPKNIALCDSSGYNYASGRLDHQTYDRSIDIDESDIEDIVLDVLLTRWLENAMQIPGYLPARTASLLRDGTPHVWMWRKRPHVDPTKQADAQKTRLESGVTTIAREIAEDAEDFEDHADELLREVEWYRSKGLVHPAERAASKSPAKSAAGADTSDPDEEVPDDTSGDGESHRQPSRAAGRNGQAISHNGNNRITGGLS